MKTAKRVWYLIYNILTLPVITIFMIVWLILGLVYSVICKEWSLKTWSKVTYMDMMFEYTILPRLKFIIYGIEEEA